MAYSFQTFSYLQVFTSVQANQLEENILKHEHGVTANCQALTLYATLSENEVITGRWMFNEIIRLSGERYTYIDYADDPDYCNIFRTGAGAGDFDSEAGHLVIQARVHDTVYRDIIFAGGITTANDLMRITGEGKVGIGTSDPGNKLEVRVNVAQDGIKIINDLNGGNTAEYYYAKNDAGTLKGGYILLDPDAQLFSFLNSSGYGINVSEATATSGYVGIGGIAPSFLLHVSKSVAGDAVVRIVNESVTGYGINIKNGLDTNYALAILNAAGTGTLWLYGNGQIKTDIATGTAPLVIASTTVCTNLNADTVDGLHAEAAISGFVRGITTHVFNNGIANNVFDFVTNITESAYESIGPTGSGATNIWSALDSLPATAKAIIVTCQCFQRHTTTTGPANFNVTVKGLNTSNPHEILRQYVYLGTVADYYGTSNLAVISLMGNLTFQLIWNSTNSDLDVGELKFLGWIG